MEQNDEKTKAKKKTFLFILFILFLRKR